MVKSNKHYRICGYVRVSTEEQAESPEGSIKNQEERIRQAVRHKIETGASVELVDVFVDAGLSAKNMKRPALQKMLSSIKRKEINLVIVTELSRLSRNTKDFCDMWDFLETEGCEFQSLREQFDTTNAAGIMLLKSLANFAEFERKQTAERVSASFKVRAERGLWNGGAVPLGYRPTSDKTGGLVIHEEEAKTIRAAYKAYLDQDTMSSAAIWLNDNGYKITKKMVNGGSFRLGHFMINTLHKILTNKAYIGVRVFKTREGKKETKANWDAIVDDDTFIKVQKKLAHNQLVRKKGFARPDRWPYLLSGIIYCGVCGHRMSGHSAHGAKKKYSFYEHNQAAKIQGTLRKKLITCNPHRFSGDTVEKRVWASIEDVLNNPKVAKEIVKQAQLEHSERGVGHEEDRFKNRIDHLTGQLNALSERLSELPADLDASPIYKQMKKISLAKRENEDRLLEVRRNNLDRSKPCELDDYLTFLEDVRNRGLEGLTPFQKQKVIESLISKIEILPEGMRIHFIVSSSDIKKGPGKTGPSLIASQCSTSLTIGGDKQDRTASDFLNP